MQQKEEVSIKRKRAPMLHYSERLKRAVCQEYLLGQKGQQEILREYGVRFKGAIPYWLRELNLDNTRRKGVIRVMKKKALHTPESDKRESKEVSDQSARIKELERKLEDSQLQAEAYLRIIEFAERELKLPIRKKPNTK